MWKGRKKKGKKRGPSKSRGAPSNKEPRLRSKDVIANLNVEIAQYKKKKTMLESMIEESTREKEKYHNS